MIEIKFSGATPHEVQQQILDFATPYIEKALITALPEQEPPKQQRKTKATEAPKQEQPPAEPENTGTWEPGGGEAVEQPTEEPVSGEAPSYTFVDIRAKGIEAAGKYGQPAVKAILTELGVKGMSELKEDQFAAFVEKLEGLGDDNA